jgi:FKBP-type peptidyl-prolyl cis-trans isomerase SlyD
MEIKPGKFVAVSYKLVGLQEGQKPEEIEETQPGRPLTFIYGTGSMLESFEKHLENLKPGDKFKFVIPADEAYGQPDPENIIDLPKEIFVVDGKFDADVVVEGAVLPMRDANGHTLNGVVEAITDTTVRMDFNHPMAGVDLSFEGTVEEVREPREEDIHTCGGGCGCGDDCESGCGCGCEH